MWARVLLLSARLLVLVRLDDFAALALTRLLRVDGDPRLPFALVHAAARIVGAAALALALALIYAGAFEALGFLSGVSRMRRRRSGRKHRRHGRRNRNSFCVHTSS